MSFVPKPNSLLSYFQSKTNGEWEMLSEAKWVYERMRLYELLNLYPAWSNRQYATALGHDHKWVQKWKKRLGNEQEISVKSFQSLPRLAKLLPQSIPEEAKVVVCQLREELSEKFHRPAGAKTILYALKKIQESQKPAFHLPLALRSINKILRERGYIQPRQERFREPLVLPAPMEE